MTRKTKNKKRLVVGLTGGIATGKTTFSYLFKQLGAEVICCDTLAHRALHKNTKTYRKIVEAFGQSILSDDLRIDRKKLGAVVFKNKEKRKKLENIIHPFVFSKLFAAMEKARGVVICDVPLLFETGFEKHVDMTLLIWCSKKEQVHRLGVRDGLTKAAAEARINAQMPLSIKKRKADHLIKNDDLETAVGTAKTLWKELQSKSTKK